MTRADWPRFEVDTGFVGRGLYYHNHVALADGASSVAGIYGPTSISFTEFPGSTTAMQYVAEGVIGPVTNYDPVAIPSSASNPRPFHNSTATPGRNGGTTAFAFGLWFKFDVKTHDQVPISQYRPQSSRYIWRLRYETSADRMVWQVHDTTEVASATAAATVTANNHGAITTGEWHFALGYWDGSTEVGISVDGSAFDTDTFSGTVAQDGTATITVGADDGGDDPVDGQVGGVFWYSADLPGINEVRALWGGGGGSRLLYPRREQT